MSVERLAGGEESVEGLENARGSAGRLEGDNSGSGQGMVGGFFLPYASWIWKLMQLVEMPTVNLKAQLLGQKSSSWKSAWTTSPLKKAASIMTTWVAFI